MSLSIVLSPSGGSIIALHLMPSHPTSPPCGWNSFDSFGGYLHERAAFAQLEAQAAKLAPHGYDFFVVDIGWHGEHPLKPGTLFPAGRTKHALTVHLDKHGRPLPSRCYFPNGFRKLIDRTHELGIKFGLHLMRGIPRQAVDARLPVKGAPGVTAADIADRTSMCAWCHYNYGIDMNRLGAQAYYDSVVAQCAEWGVDFIKADDITAYPREVAALAEAVGKCGRDILISLSPGGEADPQLLPVYKQCGMLRITKDIWDDPESIERSFNTWSYWQRFTQPEVWLDFDMIPFGRLQTMSPQPGPDELPEGTNPSLCGKGFTRECQLSLDERRTFITQRALAASPLFMGGDLTTLSNEDLDLLTNPRMLSCLRNGMGARLAYAYSDVHVWHAFDHNHPTSGWLGVFNRNPAGQTETLTLTAERLNLLSHVTLHDIWEDRLLGTLADRPHVTLPALGCCYIAYGPDSSRKT